MNRIFIISSLLLSRFNARSLARSDITDNRISLVSPVYISPTCPPTIPGDEKHRVESVCCPIEIITTSEVGWNVTKRDFVSDIKRYIDVPLSYSYDLQWESIFELKKKKKYIYLSTINQRRETKGELSWRRGLSQSLLIVLQATRKISKCGYLFVAPGWDFSNPLNRTKVRKILGPIENLYPPAFRHARRLYAVYTAAATEATVKRWNGG